MSLLANAAREAAQSTSTVAVVAGQTETRPDDAQPGVQQPTAATVPANAVTLPAIDRSADLAAARTAERDRIKAIITHPEAEGRAAMAQQFAFTTDLAADTVGGLLATAPKAEAAPPRTLTGATVPQPNIAPQGGGSEQGDAKASLSAAVQAEVKASRRG